MFRALKHTIRELNSDANNVVNSEKAKNLRKKLLSAGIPMAVVGFIGVFACFILFATAGFDAFDQNGFTARVLVPFFLIIPCAIVASIGSTLTSLGFTIVVTGYTTQLIEETVHDRCSCGNKVAPDEIFCSHCGKSLDKKCANCGHVNELKSNFCSKCGTKIKK